MSARTSHVLCVLVFALTAAAHAKDPAIPEVSVAQAGSVIQDVTIDTHGITTPSIASRYLTMHKGSVLTQPGVDQDYGNLRSVAGYIPSLSIVSGDAPHTVRLHWNIAAKPFVISSPPYYAGRPLAAPFAGIGGILTSPPVDRRGTNFSLSAHAGAYADRFGTIATIPLRVNADRNRESDLVAGFTAGRGVYRQPYPPNQNIYSWDDQYHIDYLLHNANDTEIAIGVRRLKATTRYPSGIVSPYIYETSRAPAQNTLLEAGVLHGCIDGTRLYPPYCSFQYRAEISNAVGGFGSTSKYQVYGGGAAGYVRAGNSTFAAQLLFTRTGGVLPDSTLTCSAARAYPKPFCGTDAQLVEAEYRIGDTLPHKVKFLVFFEDAAARVRGEVLPTTTSQFQWHSDAGIGVTYRNMLQVDLAYGSAGGRVTFALQGTSF
jgi:hypothetical protein